uniref:SWIM-type domain-containing protein n=1 Tax=Arundo donax TaxID=35708 RepID=A0A0A9G831_ARUDO
MFLVAFGIFDKETESNWEWFLRQLQNCIGNQPGLVIHSDANKGLEIAIPKVFNMGVEHRECFRHLLSNFKKKFNGTILCHMWPAAWAYRTDKFQQYMDKVAAERPDAIKYLEENHKHLWSRCMFSTVSKVEYVNNNLAECFNSWIRKIKEYPLVELVDTLRQMIMVKLFERRKIAEKLIGLILPCVINELNKKSRGLHYTLHGGSWTAAEAPGMSKDKKPWRVVVDVMGGTCSCGQWQLTGKPCTHALALIFSNPELKLEYMVSGFYSVESFKAAYSGVLTPIGDKADWPKVDPGFVMLPPLLDRSTGRPRKKRIKRHDEPETNQRVCRRCKQYGHIARTCKNRMAEPGTMPHHPPENYKR